MMDGLFHSLILAFNLVTRGGPSNPSYFTYQDKLLPIPKLDSSSIYGDPIPVLYTNDPSSVSQWIEDHDIMSGLTVLGWDVESVPNVPWRKVDYIGPATVQMSTVEASLVVHLCDKNGRPIKDTVPVIQDVLSNPDVIKAGVGIDQDMLELVRAWESSNEDICGRFDMSGIGGINGRAMSLKNLAKGILGVDLFKSKKLAMSNWGSVPLTDKQIDYAARDAWASAAILEELGRRDPKTYSPQSLLDLVAPDEIGMKEMDVRARARKDAKTQYFDIVGKGDTKVDRKDLSKEQLGEAERLQGVMKMLAPPRYYKFDVEHLGIMF